MATQPRFDTTSDPMAVDDPRLAPVVAAAAALSQAPPDLVAARQVPDGFTRKYLTSVADAAAVVRGLRGTHAAIGPVATRWIRLHNTYLDTPRRQAFHDHRRKRRSRAKVRVRTEGADGAPRIEVNGRRRGARIAAVLPRASHDAPLTEAELDFVRREATWFGAVGPVMRNTFLRPAIVGVEHDEHVTIDVGIQFSHEDRRAALPNTCVVEVRRPVRRAATPTTAALDALGARRGGVSKYCIGSILLDDALPLHTHRGIFGALERIEPG